MKFGSLEESKADKIWYFLPRNKGRLEAESIPSEDVEEIVTPQLPKVFAIRLQATDAPPVFCKSERVNTLNF